MICVIRSVICRCVTRTHTARRFSEDGISFSVNVDDPTVVQANMEAEYSLLRRMGFNEAIFATAVSWGGCEMELTR